MTNMMPQAPNNNQGLWANLESYCRTLVSQGNELYIVAGPRGQGGQGSNGGITQKLDNNRVVVPSNTWKAIVVLPVGNTDLSRISNQTRVIAVDIPNTQSVGSSWGNYRISVDELENLTGFDLFDLIPASIQDQIEAQVDNGPTN
jgi:endonuclease G